VGGEAGGHPAPDEVSALVLVRAVVRAVRIPVIGAGGVADGAGVAAMFALGAEGAQLGTRFLLTEEATVHQAYKQKVLEAGIDGTTLVGRGGLPVRQVRNRFTEQVEAAERGGQAKQALDELYKSRTLKHAALEGDVEWGKVEAGQAAGLIPDILPAAEVVRRLVAEAEAVRRRLAGSLAITEPAA
jgi:enoyl-[acyl-carrier protein] reductase II